MFELGTNQRPVLFFFISIFIFGPVQTERFEPKNKNEDDIGRRTPYDWSNREKEAQETGWARFRFQVLFNRFCI